jgi:uncharacterized membrane protein YphA (DoxX/SURF4 family)
VFRVAAIYVFLWSVQVAHNDFGWPDSLTGLHWASAVAPWTGRHVLHLAMPLGESVANWVADLVLAAFALLGGGVWTALDGKRANYRVLDQWLRVWVRFTLACMLFSYGWAKVYPMQFHDITRTDLVRPLGDLTHVKLMWRFMAASKPYTVFAGCMEVAAGVMLLVPGLTEAGALLCLVVMSNVAIMDVAYNVIVKLLPVHLVLLTLYLCAPQLVRMADVLVWNRAVAPWAPARLSRRPWVDWGVKGLLGIVGGVICVQGFLDCRQLWAERQRRARADVPLEGIWQVETFSASGGVVFTPAQAKALRVAPGEDRWLRVVFDEPETVTIQTMNGALDDFDWKFDPGNGKAEMADDEDKSWKGELTLTQTGPDALSVQGQVNGAAVTATLRRVDETGFPLRDEGLHLWDWNAANSSPYGR